jgi:CheY-like chemotaxis protein
MALRLEKLRILVIEDNKTMCSLICSVLENLGIGRVTSITNPLQSLSKIKDFEPDVIITDWQMDKVDGIKLTKTIRNHEGSPNRFIPILMITGYNTKKRVEMARDAGVTEFLIKPFTADDVAKRLSHIINNPRNFVDSQQFFGPDRRRRDDPAYNGEERRESE